MKQSVKSDIKIFIKPIFEIHCFQTFHNVESGVPKIGNQIRMPTISTPIQHSTGIPSQSN
jgi:hypothetical protein